MMLLERAHEQLSWPPPNEILSPTGEGVCFYARLANEKLRMALSRRADAEGVEIGIITADPTATTAPIAIICNFPKKVSDDTLREAHKLAWNFGYVPLLITIEPHILRTWTCCEPPEDVKTNLIGNSPEIEPSLQLNEEMGTFSSEKAAASLHWIELLTGQFFERNEARFRPEKRADQMLLANLREIRQKLKGAGLVDDDVSHDLLARIIFIQFLFDRKDTDGTAALNPVELRRLHEDEKVLSAPYSTFSQILDNYQDTYKLFRWLNDRFNGDLFPGKGTASEQVASWNDEQSKVRPEHLSLLSRFVRGEEVMRDGQLSLWPYYVFDVIPLEVISTIYEQFVKKGAGTGIHYTPAHVADLLLDSVLPWNGHRWDLKILDPSCGSGVFLVKAYQRLIHRWKLANNQQRITGKILSELLEKNIFGMDLDAHAVRTASFSLYLAMCDEIDPRDYWREVHFPILRGRRLIASDFFNDESSSYNSDVKYDIVVGNPPWGKNTATLMARLWQEKNDWTLPYGDIGPLFIARSIAMTQPGGYVALLQPASTLLYNSTSAARQFRVKLFSSVKVEEVINLSPFRFSLFQNAVKASCAIVLQCVKPDGQPFWYVCPKPLKNGEDRYRIIIEPQDIHYVYVDEVINTPWVWSTLLWGGRRDLALVHNLNSLDTVQKLEERKILSSRQGIIRGDRKTKLQQIVGRRFFSGQFSESEELFLDASSLPINSDASIHSHDYGHDMSAFESPQLIVKQSWSSKAHRYKAALVIPDATTRGVICNDSYLSIHSNEENKGYLESACVAYNSSVTVYYLLLTSGRFAMERPEPLTRDLRQVPLPKVQSRLINHGESSQDIEFRLKQIYNLKESEWILIDDLMRFTLPEYKEGNKSAGRQITHRLYENGATPMEEPELTRYCEILLRVMHAAYGDNKLLGSVIYSESDDKHLPVRTVSLFLNLPNVARVRAEPITSENLQRHLTTLYRTMFSNDGERSQFYKRTARTYETIQGSDGQIGIRINFIKPDQMRYWTQSVAMRDADAIVSDMVVWANASDDASTVRKD